MRVYSWGSFSQVLVFAVCFSFLQSWDNEGDNDDDDCGDGDGDSKEKIPQLYMLQLPIDRTPRLLC